MTLRSSSQQITHAKLNHLELKEHLLFTYREEKNRLFFSGSFSSHYRWAIDWVDSGIKRG